MQVPQYAFTRLFILILLGLAISASAQTVDCKEPNVLVVFDVSGSMGLPVPGTKYTQAVEALAGATAALDDDIRFGLLMFPAPNGSGCDLVATPQIGFELGNADEIFNLLAPAGANFWGGPTATHDTPMFQALAAASGLPDLQSSNRRHYVLLVTDGMQDCCISGDYDNEPDCLPGSTTLDPAEAQDNIDDLVNVVSEMAGNDVQTFVVGFGQNVDPLSLNQMSVAGQTQKPGCNASQTDASAADGCYYNATNQAALEAALLSIAQLVTEESCDGIDNDCDGETDEDFPTLGQICDGSDGDACQNGELVCSEDNQSVVCAEAGIGFVDLCNGIDEDCDGETDEDFPTLGDACDGEDDDQCTDGVIICSASEKQVECSEPGEGKSEACNGIDDDCDGATDEEFPTLGDACDGEDDDQCTDGVIICSASENQVECSEPGEGKSETCNGIDDDCDGAIDEGELCGIAEVCESGVCISTRDDSPGDVSVSTDVEGMPDVFAGDTSDDAEDQPANDISSRTTDVADAMGADTRLPLPVDAGVDVSGQGIAPPAPLPPSSGDDGGCGCRVSTSQGRIPAGPAIALVMFAVGVVSTRRRAGTNSHRSTSDVALRG